MKTSDELSFMSAVSPRGIDWNIIEHNIAEPFAGAMKKTPQNPEWHGEGDVWTHTKNVCEELIRLKEYQLLSKRQQEVLFLAALLHDIGKISCTKIVDGELVSPHHGPVGSRMAREYLWKQFDLCGDKDKIAYRETVCLLIRYHTTPLHIIEYDDYMVRLRRIASDGELTGDFSLKLLCILSEADIKGRISSDRTESLEKIELCKESAVDCGCYDMPYLFPSPHTQNSYLSGKDISPDHEYYDNTWGEVILMSGLPGTGKDIWINKYYYGIPAVSLDKIRKANGISPKGNQSVVVSIAQQQAREYLRKHHPFVWNATTISSQIRRNEISLFCSYGASVRIIYLETEWNEELRRNSNRSEKVPVSVIENMLGNMTLPERFEAHNVEWICV